MVKQLYNLTLNEIIKKYKKKSLIIITLIIFAVGIAYPLLMKKTYNNLGAVNSFGYGFTQGELQQKIEAIKTTTADGKVEKAFLESQVKQQQLLADVEANPQGWKAQESENYLESLLKIDALKALKSGTNPKIIMGEVPEGVNPAPIAKIVATPKDKIDSEISKIQKEATNTENSIKNNEYLNYLKKDIKAKEDNLKTSNKNLDKLKKELKKDSQNTVLKTEIDKLQTNIDNANSQLKIEKYRYDNKIAFNEKDWKSATLTEIAKNIPFASEKIMSKGEYLASSHGKISYETYSKVFNKAKKNAENVVKIGWYSLKHNIPQDSLQAGARTVTQNGVKVFVVIIAILGAILAGGLVANEFAKGTIRLLLIRPTKRWKILISKFISVLIISYVVLFISMIITGIVSGLLFGFDSFGYSILKVVGGQVVETNAILQIIKELLFNSITIIFIISISFAISTVAKSTAAAVATSIIIFIGSFPIAIELINKNYLWVLKSPIPYIDLPVVKAIQMIEPQVLYNSKLGAIELIIISIILVIISLVVFCKKDITN